MKTFLTLVSLAFTLTFAPVVIAKNGPMTCSIQTATGNYLTAVSAGGLIDDTIHSNATQARAWEKFTLVDSDAGSPNITYGIRTSKKFYVTAVDGGGRITDVIHTNATQLRDWEKFQLVYVGNGYYAIQTYQGTYLTAVGGGGRITDVIHSDAKKVGAWEKFRFKCGLK